MPIAIVDEVDSILIDEARTPLIISGPLEDRADLYQAVDAFMKHLETEDFELDEKQRQVSLTEAGNEKMEKLLAEAGHDVRARSTTSRTSPSCITSIRR